MLSELLTARHLAKAYTTKTARRDVLRSIDVDIRPGNFASDDGVATSIPGHVTAATTIRIHEAWRVVTALKPR